MISKLDSLADYTDEMLDDATENELRAIANEFIPDDLNIRDVVVSITLTDTVLTRSGALTKVDDAISSLYHHYNHAGMEPKRSKRNYSDQLTLTVWASEDNLRYTLKYKARDARVKAAQEAAENEPNGTE